MALARHVAYVHRNLKNPEGTQAVRDKNDSMPLMHLCWISSVHRPDYSIHTMSDE